MNQSGILSHLQPVDMITRGIGGFSFVHVPGEAPYVRLELTDDYDAAACLHAETWFHEKVLPAMASNLAAVYPDYAVAGKYCMGRLEELPHIHLSRALAGPWGRR